jgi:hypothetical protein
MSNNSGLNRHPALAGIETIFSAGIAEPNELVDVILFQLLIESPSRFCRS